MSDRAKSLCLIFFDLNRKILQLDIDDNAEFLTSGGKISIKFLKISWLAECQ